MFKEEKESESDSLAFLKVRTVCGMGLAESGHLCKLNLFCLTTFHKVFKPMPNAVLGQETMFFFKSQPGQTLCFGLIRLIDLWDRAVEFWWNTSPDRFGSQLFFGQDK